MTAVLLGCLASTGCGDSADPTESSDLELSGIWTGELTATTTAGSFVASAILSIAQTGTAVTGSIDLLDDELLSVSGSVSGSVLTITMTPAESAGDDCHNFPVTLVFSATATTLTATSASGEACEGDGVGGHSSLDTVTGASGTLMRT